MNSNNNSVRKGRKAQVTNNSDVTLLGGKLPPQAIEMEEYVLGALMLDKNAFIIVSDILYPDSFYKPSNVLIYTAIQTLYRDKQPIDIATVVQQLRRMGELDNVGGPFAITQFTNKIASAANIEFHARIIEQQSIKRRIIASSMSIVTRAFDETYDVFDLLADVQTNLSDPKINIQGSSPKPEIRAMKAHDAIMKAQNEDCTGYGSGVEELDELIGGFEPGDFWIIAARPGMGKTAAIVSIAKHVEKKYGPVYIDELEMSDVTVAMREISYITGINSRKLKARLNPTELTEVASAIESIKKSKVFINTEPYLRVSQLRSRVKKAVNDYGCLMYIIDYIGLVELELAQGENRTTGVGKVTRMLKIIAKENNIPVIGLNQLNRSVESRPDKRPILSDLRDSGNIEQDADGVIFLFRPEYYGFETINIGGGTYPSQDQIEWIVAKNRNGNPGSVWSSCNIACNRFGKAYYNYDELDIPAPLVSTPKEQKRNLGDY